MFNSLNSVLTWFINNNPARPKYLNLLEPELGRTFLPDDFAVEHPQRLFSEILNAIHGALVNNPRDARLLFNFCELGRPFGARVHPKDAAKLIHISERAAYRLLKRVKDDLSEDLKRRRILDSSLS